MLKIALFALLIGAISAPDLFAYVDMSKTAQRANDLKITTANYAFSMSIAGTLTGFLFGLFLWKVR